MSSASFLRNIARASRMKNVASLSMRSMSTVKKFNLPPIPIDGIYRRPEIDYYNSKPLVGDFDTYFMDTQAPETVYDSNGGEHISPALAAQDLALVLFLTVGCMIIIPSLLTGGNDGAPRIITKSETFATVHTSEANFSPQTFYVSL